MILKDFFSFTNNRQIWRVIPADDKLIIEERDTEAKVAFFNCVSLSNGSRILDSFQPEEKFWTGIEAVKDNIIYFHNFEKPDMPSHRSVIAFSLIEKKILWQNQDLKFSFLLGKFIYCYRESFEGRKFFALDRITGKMVEELKDENIIKSLQQKANQEVLYPGCLFPQSFSFAELSEAEEVWFAQFKNENIPIGEPEFIRYSNYTFFNFHKINDDGTLKNIFRVVNYLENKNIFEEILNDKINAIVPDSFFIKDDLLFLLKEKSELKAYKIS